MSEGSAGETSLRSAPAGETSLRSAPGRSPPDARAGLPLEVATDPQWVFVAASNLPHLLQDHAHCELKAASQALSLVARYADDSPLVGDLLALAREEMRHFDRVRQVLAGRGLPLPPVGPDRYVKELRRLSQRGLGPGLVGLDALLTCGFVEARSCERFRLLGAHLEDADLRDLFLELGLAEARHHELFFEHAARRSGAEPAAERARAIARIEGELVRSLPLAPRIH